MNTGLALTAICILVVWFASGLTMMLLMAGMQGIPTDLYESAEVDGASWWQKERRVTLPLLRRTIALSLIISVIGSFLAFNQFFILTEGGPGTSTVPVVMWIYEDGVRAVRTSACATAMSVVLVVVVGLISAVQFHLLRGAATDGTVREPAMRPWRAGRRRAARAGARPRAGRGRDWPYLSAGVRGTRSSCVPLVWAVFRSIQPSAVTTAPARGQISRT